MEQVQDVGTMNDLANLFPGGGEAGSLVRATDWSKTALGEPARWHTTLKGLVRVMLHARQPMLLWWGPELVQLYNDAILPSFGQGRHPTAMGQRARDCWTETWPVIGAQIEDVLATGTAIWHEDVLVPIFRNGAIDDAWWVYNYSPVFDDDGTRVGVLIICTETTARVLAERRQKVFSRLAERLRLAETDAQIIEQALDVIALSNDDIPFALAVGFEDPTGLPKLLGATGLSSEDALALMSQLTPALLDPLVRDRTAVSAPHDVTEVFVARRSASTGSAASGEGWLSLVLAINPRRQFDEQAQDFLSQMAHQIRVARSRLDVLRVRAVAEAERNNLLVQAPMPTALLVGPTHVFTLANTLYQRMVGRSNLVGKAYEEAFPELIGTAVPVILKRVYDTGEPFVTHELLIPFDRHGSGKVEDAYFQFNLEPLRDLEGRVYGMMAVATDITEQVMARHAIEKAHDERQKLVDDLEIANRAKDDFLAILGHELRNPLAPIVTAIDLIKSEQIEVPKLDIIERHVAHLVRLVDDLLDVSKFSQGKILLKQETVNLDEVLTGAVEMTQFLMEQRRHHVAVEISPGLRWHGDRVRLAQALSNLLTNAARYTPYGGHIRLTADTEGGVAERRIVIRVKDDGIGISVDLLPRVFDLFVQGGRSSDRAEGGLGVGLSLVKSLVELHGGTVTANSEGLGKGSEFTIRLCLADETATAPLPPVVVPAASVQPQRILLVDDNKDGAEVLAMLLESFGHQVAVAHDPHAAIELAKSFTPSLAILDIGLPGMDGYALAAKLREHSDYPLIALTGFGQDQDRSKSADAGFTHHLVKPVLLADLVSVVGRVTPKK
ncbi:MAG: ATP-binding protein [Polyangia bacterium]